MTSPWMPLNLFYTVRTCQWLFAVPGVFVFFSLKAQNQNWIFVMCERLELVFFAVCPFSDQCSGLFSSHAVSHSKFMFFRVNSFTLSYFYCMAFVGTANVLNIATLIGYFDKRLPPGFRLFFVWVTLWFI